MINIFFIYAILVLIFVYILAETDCQYTHNISTFVLCRHFGVMRGHVGVLRVLQVMCKLYYFVQSVSYTASVIILTVISMERYLAIIHPMLSKRLTSTCLHGAVVVIVWFIAVIYSLPIPVAYDVFSLRCVSLPYYRSDPHYRPSPSPTTSSVSGASVYPIIVHTRIIAHPRRLRRLQSQVRQCTLLSSTPALSPIPVPYDVSSLRCVSLPYYRPHPYYRPSSSSQVCQCTPV